MNFKKTITLMYTCLFAGIQLSAQTKIDIDFLRYANEPYVFSLSKGEKQDTIYSASFDAQGKTRIQVPVQYKDYVGVAQLRMKSGDGMDIILDHESHIRISAKSDNGQDIVFEGSTVNADQSIKTRKHLDLFQKGQVLQMAARVYVPGDSLYSLINNEYTRVEKEYAAFMKSEQMDTSYAAHLRKMHYFLKDVGNTLTQDQPERVENFRRFFREELDYQRAYTSSLWPALIGSWMGMHKQAVFSDSILLDDCKVILDYIPTEDLRKAWLSRMILEFARYGKEDMLIKLGVDELISVGTQAPLLQLHMQRRIVKNAVVVFHESGCHNCESEMQQLYENYQSIIDQGYEVYSIAADMDEDTFISNTFLLPWKEKYCDYKGFHGDNFKNYGIYGTPTIFVIDSEGIIVGRYAQVHEALAKIKEE